MWGGRTFGQAPPPDLSGIRPAFFDDFTYASGTGLGAGTVFGPNAWATPAGWVESRMWRRYNWDDLELVGTQISAQAAYGIDLTIPKGFGAPTHNDPAIVSGFTVGPAGVYAARVRFSAFQSAAHLIQAFWGIAPDLYTFVQADGTDREYRTELDMEWNNYFHSGRSLLDVSVKSGIDRNGWLGEGKIADCQFLWSNGTREHLPNCEGTYRGGQRSLRGTPIIPGQFYTLTLVVDPTAKQVRFSLQADQWGGASGSTMFGGGTQNLSNLASTWGSPATFASHYPARPMAMVFSQHYYDRAGTLNKAQTMALDWVYYAPDDELTPSAIASEVARIRQRSLRRVNAVPSLEWADRNSQSPHSVALTGPESVIACQQGTWTATPTTQGTTYEMTFRYEMLDDAGAVVSQGDVYGPTAALRPGSDVERIILRVRAENIWNSSPSGLASVSSEVGVTPAPPGVTCVSEGTTVYLGGEPPPDRLDPGGLKATSGGDPLRTGRVEAPSDAGGRRESYRYARRLIGEAVLALWVETEGEPSGVGQGAAVAVARVVPSEGGTAAGPDPALGAGPNPMRGTAAVHFRLPVDAPVRLAAYDALGREVALLREGELPAGAHRALFDVSNLRPGLYLLRLETPESSMTYRVTVVR